LSPQPSSLSANPVTLAIGSFAIRDGISHGIDAGLHRCSLSDVAAQPDRFDQWPSALRRNAQGGQLESLLPSST
jgi:hypothetical protein